jgi:hypothetical protein
VERKAGVWNWGSQVTVYGGLEGEGTSVSGVGPGPWALVPFYPNWRPKRNSRRLPPWRPGDGVSKHLLPQWL